LLVASTSIEAAQQKSSLDHIQHSQQKKYNYRGNRSIACSINSGMDRKRESEEQFNWQRLMQQTRKKIPNQSLRESVISRDWHQRNQADAFSIKPIRSFSAQSAGSSLLYT
jgi:hypothetical protein